LPTLRLRSLLAAALVAYAAATPSGAEAAPPGPMVAAASDLNFALEELSAAFRRDTGIAPRIAFGSSGNFVRQIEQGAPFELFFSADEAFVARLERQGLTRDQGTVYAVGHIVLFVPHGSPLVPDERLANLKRLLARGGRWRFAIANPEHAPYGRAAEQALRAYGLWEAIQPHLVLGENVSQAAQFAASGDTVGGIVAYSLVHTPGMREKGGFVLLPGSLHRPIRQKMVLLRRAGEPATRLYEYVRSPEGRTILARYGFELPAG
jgi:molybdate transport system substrate-binding protein